MDKAYLKAFEYKILEQLVKLATDKHYLGGDIYVVDELNEAWRAMAPHYMADAVPIVATYPMVSVAWAAYLGLGAASLWDQKWDAHGDYEALYEAMVNPRGFDELDEYVAEELMGMNLKSDEYLKLEDLIRSLATKCLDMIRHEGIEPQTPEAFHIYARAVKVIYVVGYSIGLYKLGYRYHKVNIE